jgi:FMN phosphatase YigB (HAD superfamily)
VIRAVVLDVGGVLGVVGDAAWPQVWRARWAGRAGIEVAALDEAFARHEPLGDLLTGEASEADFRALHMAVLGLTETDADLMMAELWDAYCGELDRELYDFFASLRDGYLLGILSNSMDGARREEGRRYGFPDLVDVLVYSHEVGVAKPDPRAYALTTERLGVAPDEVLFLDNAEPNVTAARAFGWHAVHHLTTAESIVQMRLQLGSG